jgi:RNA polymerase sigma-70 factor, ECF subfamily
MDIEPLIKRIQKGDTHLYASVMKHFEQKVFITVYRLVKNRTVAEDLVQEIFIKAFYNLPKYKQTSTFNAWLYRLAMNYCLDYLRKAKKSITTDEIESIEQQYPEKILLLYERNQALEQLLKQLEEIEYMVLLLRYVNELSYEEISDVLQISLNEVRNKLHRSKQKLRILSKAQGGDLYEM